VKSINSGFAINLRIVVLIGISLLGLIAIVASGGGGGGGGGNSDSGEVQSCLSNKNYNSSSYELQKTCLYVNRQGIRQAGFEGFALAVVYADFDLDGYCDVFISSGDGTDNATPVEMYLNDGFDNFILSNDMFVKPIGESIHPRKALTGDFNNDGVPDVFVIGHGYDKPPFPGEHPLLILSKPDGFQSIDGLESYVGFQHGGASADIDGDHDLDIFVADMAESFFLKNDGYGNFNYETDIVPDDLDDNIYTAELIDIDSDGYYDLLVAGHEHDGMPTTIYWGSDTYAFSSLNKTILPAVPGQGTVLDIDAEDIDGDNVNDVILTRTGGGQNNSYVGFYIQILINQTGRSLADETNQRIPNGAGDDWIDWIRLQDFDNDSDIDIIVDDAERDLVWLNNGEGYFQKF
jgi:hypothetical protein